MKAKKQSSKSRFSLGSAGNKDAYLLFAEVDHSLLSLVATQATRLGVAVTFATTRDGSSACVSILDDGRVDRAYATTVEELAEILEHIADLAETLLLEQE